MQSFRFSSEIFHADADADVDADTTLALIYDLIQRWKEVGRDVGEW